MSLVTSALTVDVIKAAINRLTSTAEKYQGELNECDSQLGDGDLGVTLVRGFHTIEKASGQLPEDVGKALLLCARGFTQVSGSTYGTLMATAGMAVAKRTTGRTSVPWDEMHDLLGEAIDAMSRIGKAQLGDKTVLDALEAVRVAVKGMTDPELMAKAAHQAAADATEEFKGKPCRQGRARIWAEKSIGMPDPGMVAMVRMLGSLAGIDDVQQD